MDSFTPTNEYYEIRMQTNKKYYGKINARLCVQYVQISCIKSCTVHKLFIQFNWIESPLSTWTKETALCSEDIRLQY